MNDYLDVKDKYANIICPLPFYPEQCDIHKIFTIYPKQPAKWHPVLLTYLFLDAIISKEKNIFLIFNTGGEHMKIKNITEPQKFFEVLKQAKGKVELVTSEGDRLNLKSTLCQYIALTQMFKDATIDEVELLVSEPEDLNLLLNYLVRG